MAEYTPTPEQVEAFKRAWHEADVEGDAGNRVLRGLSAAGPLIAAEALAPWHAECDKVGIPYDPAGLVRHHRGNAGLAAAMDRLVATTVSERERDEARARSNMYRSVLREHGVDPDALDATLARGEGS